MLENSVSKTFKTGVSVSETKAEISTAAPITIPNSLNKLPTKPSRKIIGKNTTAKVTEVAMTAKKISSLPSRAARYLSYPSSNFLNMFSVTTIPSSTTRPVASTIASSVNTFIVKPEIYIIKKVAIKETGISINGRIAINQSLKNR